MFKFGSLFIRLVLVSLATSATVDPDIDLDSDEHFTILVSMKDSNFHLLDKLSSRSFPSREERVNSVAKKAQKHASKSQKSLLKFLQTEGQSQARSGKVEPEVTSLWIINAVIIKNADATLIKELSSRPDIDKIQLDRPMDFEGKHFLTDSGSDSDGDSPDGPEDPWAITAMNVPAVWAKGIRGEGIVVANIDSGVLHTHEALRSNFIGAEGGWFDVEGKPVPWDKNGHGTKTISAVVGTTRNIGVAPGAKWMACKHGKGTPNAADYICDTLRCCQWVVCPGASSGVGGTSNGTDPGAGKNCGQVPHVLSNSWGYFGEYQDFFDKTVLYFYAAGIIPVFAAGNGGPGCGVISYPGGHSYALSVGATQKDNKVWEYSSRGPPPHDVRLIKPDLVAPGHRVRLATCTTDTSYNVTSGTSFATPYTAGVVVLMLSKNPNLRFKDIKEILLASTVSTVGSGETCGEKPDDVFPNFIAGHGRLDALKAIEYVENMNKG